MNGELLLKDIKEIMDKSLLSLAAGQGQAVYDHIEDKYAPEILAKVRQCYQVEQKDRPKFNNALEADAHNWDTRELDRPDREKVADFIRRCGFHSGLVHSEEISEKTVQYCTGKILTLFPDCDDCKKKLYWHYKGREERKVGEAKREERERIQSELEFAIKVKALNVSNGVLLWDIVQDTSKQALKEY